MNFHVRYINFCAYWRMKSLFARLLNIIPSFVHVDNGNGIISKRKRMFLQHDCTPSNTVPRNNLVPGLISTQLPAKLSKITPKFANYLFQGKSSTGSASRAKHFVASSRFNQPLENYRNWQVVCETLRLIEEASERKITRIIIAMLLERRIEEHFSNCI